MTWAATDSETAITFVEAARILDPIERSYASVASRGARGRCSIDPT